MNKVSASSEDYLKTIVMIGGAPDRPVRSVDVARRMHVSKTAVSNAIVRLKEAGLVEQEFYGQIALTEQGFAYGRELAERFRFFKSFFTEKLGIADDVAERDACSMEHAISDECFEKLMAFIDGQE